MTASSPASAASERLRIRELDWLMLAVVGLCCLGLLMAVSVQSVPPDGDPLLVMKDQGAKLVAGIVLFVACAAVPLDLLRRAAPWLFAIAAGLVYFAALFGPNWNGAHRWISIGGRSFQPVDLARLCLIVTTAAMIARSGDRIHELGRGLVRVLLPTLILAAGLFLQPDNGNALLCVCLGTTMALCAGVALRWMAIGAVTTLPILALVVGRHGYVMARIESFLTQDPPQQVAHSLISFRGGGAFGQGIGGGYGKLGHVPESHNDFVYAMVGEELGFVGAAAVVVLYVLIGWVGWRLVNRIQDPFHRYVVFGCTLAICVQAAINLLVTTGLAPAKGIDLPFVSAGGTNLMASLGAVGLIGNAARSDLAGRGADFDSQGG
jgi:cell division protein FtsW